MAVKKGKEITNAEYKRYWGIASVKVICANPDKKTTEKLFGRELQEEPVYTGKNDDVPYARIDFVVKTDNESTDIDLTTRISFFLRKQYRTNRDNTKVQVIDKYGRTAWVTAAQLADHEIPVYSNGPANLDKDYRKAYIGEADLTSFIITYLNIPSPMNYINKKWVMKSPSELEDCEARLDHIEDYFKGDFSEIKEIATYQPENVIKVLIGIRTNENGQFMSPYTRFFVKGNSTNYDRLIKDVQSAQAAGALPTTEFTFSELQEYKPQPSNVDVANTTMPEVEDDPFA